MTSHVRNQHIFSELVGESILLNKIEWCAQESGVLALCQTT